MQSALLGADGVAADRTTTIVMTTSIMSVARHCSSGAGHVYSMQTLDDANSRKLFFTTLATSGSSAPPSHAVEQESSAILKKCDGLPLALVSTAQFLKENRMAAGVHGCEEISRRLHALPKDGTVLERMHQVLVQSYGSLPSTPIRDCLLYFCMFPPEHGVETGPLVRRLLAEGIVQNPHEAVENLRILMDHSIIQSSQVSNNDGAAKRYRTHGMMLEYVSRESMSEKFTTLLRPAETVREPDSVRRLSVHHDRISGAANYVGLMLPEEDLSRLHTLSVFPTSATTNYLQQGSLLHAADQADHLKLCRYELLRVLDLKHCPHLRKKHLEAICDALFLLKYLSFGGSLHRVPRNIKKLKRLETLDLSRSEIVTVYKEAILLPKLKHLLGKFQLSKSDTKLRGTGYLERLLQEKSDLETLSGFVTGERKGFPQLMSHMASRRLSKVKIWCKPNADAENLHHLKEGIKAFVSQDNHRPKVDYSLSIDSHECQIPFLESLEAPGSLSSLKLHGRLNKIPPFVALAQLAAVRELSLSGTGLSGAVVLAGLSGLTRLKYLKLCEAKMGPLTIGAHQVPSLERICLVGENTMTGIKFEDGALQYLVSLHLLCQALIHVLPDYQIGGLPNLTEVVLHSGLAQAIKDAWKEDARRHPNRPSISFTGGP